MLNCYRLNSSKIYKALQINSTSATTLQIAQCLHVNSSIIMWHLHSYFTVMTNEVQQEIQVLVKHEDIKQNKGEEHKSIGVFVLKTPV